MRWKKNRRKKFDEAKRIVEGTERRISILPHSRLTSACTREKERKKFEKYWGQRQNGWAGAVMAVNSLKSKA